MARCLLSGLLSGTDGRKDGRTRTAEGDSADERPLRIDAVGYWPSKLGSDCLKSAFFDSASATKSAFIKVSRHH